MLSALAFLLQPMNRSQMKDNAGLLHEIGIEGDHPKRVLTSIVEIVINNEDRSLPIESESDRVIYDYQGCRHKSADWMPLFNFSHLFHRLK